MTDPDSTPPSKPAWLMGVSATVAICGVVVMVAKLYGNNVSDISTDVNAIRASMASDDERELRDAMMFGGILARLDALEEKVE